MGRKLLGIFLIAFIALLLALFGPWNAKKRSMEMKTSIENAFDANGIKGVNVDMSGNVAKLSGTVGSQGILDKAKKIAAATECKTCKKKGKIWHGVESDLKVKEKPKPPAVPMQRPYTFNAAKAVNGNVNIEGYVGSKAERNRVTREAKALFGDSLKKTNLKIARGAPNKRWGDVISKYLPELSSLDRGTYLLDDTQSLITGDTTNATVRDRINALATNAGLGYKEAATITVPDQANVNVGSVSSQSVCQALFDDLKGNAKINFASAKADILGRPSLELLGRLGDAMAQCSTFGLIVEGHTDSEGQEAYNQWLSEERAKAVRNDLVSRGVDAARISAIGLGENSPKATNDTPAGKSANRRIEFKITTSE